MLNKANELLRALSDYVGADEPMRLDSDGVARCVLAGALTVFSYSEDLEELIAAAYLAPLPAGGEEREEAVREVMRGNYAWGGTDGGVLGLDESTGHVVLCRRVDVAGAAPGAFLETVARLSGLIGHWRTVLAPVEKPAAGHIIWP